MAMLRKGESRANRLQPVQLWQCQEKEMQGNPASPFSIGKLLNCEITGMLREGE